MSQPMDLMYVELRSRGEDTAARSVNDALKEIERSVERATRAIELEIARLTAFAQQEIKHLTRVVEREALQQRLIVSQSFKSIGSDVATNIDVAERSVKQLTTEISRDFSEVNSSLHGTRGELTRVADEARTGFETLKSGAQVALSSITSFVFSMDTLKLITLGAAIPAVIALGGAMVDLVGAVGVVLPALASMVTIGGTLALTFTGIGDAISALASGDVDKINEAMKKLPPSAREFSREVFALKKPFDDLRKAIQESFFREFAGSLTDLAHNVLPVLKVGLSGISGALGRLATSITELLGSQPALNTMRELFATTGRIIDKMSPIVTKLLGSLFGLVKAGLPHLERLVNFIGRGATKLTEFLNASVKSGAFNKFVSDAASTFKELINLTKSLGKLLSALFGESGDEGRSLIQILTQMVDKLTAFLNTAEGQQQLQSMLDTILLLANGLKTLVGWLTALNTFFIHVVNAIARFVVWVGQAIDSVGKFFGTVGNWVSDVGARISSFFAQVGAFFVRIGQGIAQAWNSVVSFGGRILTFFQSLPERIITFIKSLPERVRSVFTLMFDRVTYAIGFGIGAVLRYFIELPGRIKNSISSLVQLVAGVFVLTWTTATRWTNTIISNVVSFFTQLPGRIYNAIVRLISIVSSVLSSAASAGKSRAQSLVSGVMSFITQLPGRVYSTLSSVPGRVKSALSGAVDAAKSIGSSIMNGITRGIENGVGAVVDAAKRAAHNIIDGMMDALRIGSPSKLAEKSIGRNIDAGVAVGVKKGVPDVRRSINEATRSFLPSDASAFRAGRTSGQTLATTGAITFGAGAIQVNVAGALTESDARAIGAGVGQGIASTLARQRVRTQLRTV